MPSLDDHFRALAEVGTPEDWPDLEALEPGPLRSPYVGQPRRLRTRPLPRQPHRAAAAALALAVAVAGMGFAIWAFEGASRSPQPRPAATVENGKIAFVRGVDGPGTISLVDPDGSNPSQLIEGTDPAWSPDGETLAFVTAPAGEGPRYIASIPADGRGVTRLLPLQEQPGGIGPQAWSPDGSQLVFASVDGIYVMNAAGTDARRVTRYQGDHACYDLDPAWSPAGSTIVFAVLCEGGNEGLWIVGLDGSDRRPLIVGDYEVDEYRSPVWSPDGTKVAFVKTDWTLDDPINGASIYVADADGTGTTRVADGAAFDRSLVWSPDGRAIAFTGYRETGSDIFLVDLETDEVTQLTQTGDAVDPAWQPVPLDDEPPTPDTTATPEGTIDLPADAIPEGALLVQTNAGAEVIRAGSERSNSVPGVRAPLDLSPDGSTVLGLTGGDDTLGDLIAVDLLSGEARVLVHPSGDDDLGAFAQWSPDGSMVAFSLGAGDPANRSTLCVLALASSEPSCFPEAERVYTFDWAPDGDSLVVAGPPVQPVRIVDVATGEVSEVVPQEGDTPINEAIRDAGLGTSFQLVGPTWSPSGTYLAALANLEDSDFSYVPVVFTPDGRFVAFGRASGEYPEPFEWSPVADVLAYTHGEAPYRITEAYLLDPVSGDDRVLVSGEGTQSFFALTDMAWAPSGRWLAIAGWVDLGEGGFQTSFRVLDPADPASFEQFSVQTRADNFLTAWRP